MKTKLITALILSVMVSCQAQIMIYKMKATTTITGSFLTTPIPVTGYVIYDCVTGDLTGIYAFPKSHSYRVDNQWNIDTVIGARGTEYTVYSQATSSVDANNRLHLDSMMVKGANAMTDIGAVSKWRTPKTMQLIGRSVYPSSSGQMCLEESTGTLTLDLKNTKSYNTGPFNTSQVMSFIMMDFIGWTRLN